MIIDDKTAYVYEDGYYYCTVCHRNPNECMHDDEKRADELLNRENSGIDDSWYEED